MVVTQNRRRSAFVFISVSVSFEYVRLCDSTIICNMANKCIIFALVLKMPHKDVDTTGEVQRSINNALEQLLHIQYVHIFYTEFRPVQRKDFMLH